MTKIPQLNMDWVRAQFPALKDDFVFMDNAGGSQIVGPVLDRLQEYLIHHNVQLGASYANSAKAGKTLEEVVESIFRHINAYKKEEVVIGPSSSWLLRVLSICLSQQWERGDEVIISNSDHEANVSCWTDLEKRGIIIKTWKVNPDTYELELSELEKLLSPKTRLVAMVHASNILGTINPIKKIARTVHQAGALLCVDGVAFAPHRMVDVQQLEIDFYVYSFYKTYGPHLAVLFGKYELLSSMEGINHYFIQSVPYKFQPGNINYELTYSLGGILDYLKNLYDFHYSDSDSSSEIQKTQTAFDLITRHEESLSSKLLDYLSTRTNIRIIGHKSGNAELRVPTISFVHKHRKSSEIVESVDPFQIGIRFGDFYAKKIIEDLGLVDKDGVIRVSMVHYNTVDEVNKLINAFETLGI
jgi:cysteine desulfurase family protein (TIGR01976 family)